HLEAEVFGADRYVGGERVEAKQRLLPEAVDDLERGELAALEADSHRLERSVLGLGLGLGPLETVLRGQVGEIEVALERAAGEQRGRCRTECLAELPRADLVQVGVVDPDLLAVADDRL